MTQCSIITVQNALSGFQTNVVTSMKGTDMNPSQSGQIAREKEDVRDVLKTKVSVYKLCQKIDNKCQKIDNICHRIDNICHQIDNICQQTQINKFPQNGTTQNGTNLFQ